MATGIAQKSCTALFPMWSLRKNYISKMKKNNKTTTATKKQRGNVENIERNLNI